ncbi:MAG TPA: BTAD domain-containing putative transcriptional regulator [Nitrospirota bacterium]|nr:BTAD domain-containing putative transcriptional regulator [Nitrospirota bacterium]
MNAAKYLPPRPMRVLERERLLNRLLEWEDSRLVIIHGPAGQGKSTLAATFARTLGSPFVWYNIDQDDDNTSFFLSSFLQAIQLTWPQRASGIPPVPQDRYGRREHCQALDQWFGQVLAAVPPSGLLILDDCNNAPTSFSLNALLAAVVANQSHRARVIMISRVRPECGTVRLRADRSVAELGGEELRFTDAEVQELFSIVFRMQISANEAALINATTEGWPAGLVLMHGYLASLPPGERALAIADRRAAGFRTHVFDYLAQEVFFHLPAEMQRFLLRTSIVDYLSLPLIELLTGLPAAPAPGGKPSAAAHMVNDLRKRNLFVTAMNSDSTVVRYHALFREFLRRKLSAQTRPLELKRLYSSAAAHFHAAGDVVRSIDLLLASGQFARAVAQMEQCGEALIASGRTNTCIRWIESLPLDYADRPWFLFFRALACRFTDPRTALAFFESAYRGFRSGGADGKRTVGLMLSLCGIIEASFYSKGDFKRMGRAAATAKTLLAHAGKRLSGARARLLLAVGMAWFFIGRLRHGSEALRQALDLFRRQGERYYEITCAMYLAPCALYQGDFRLAREAVQKGVEANAALKDDAGGQAALSLVAAMTALFEGRFADAQECIDQCRNLADIHALETMEYLSLDIGGWLKIAQGDYRGAEQLLQECKRRGADSQNFFFSASAAHLLAIAHLFQGRPQRAKAESDYALAIQSRSGSKLFHAIYLIASGAIHLKLRRLRRAERELLTAVSMLQEIRAEQQEANAHLVLAQLYEASNEEKSLGHLEQGFSIGQKCGFRYYALFTAAELADMARTAVGRGICIDYCSGLLSGGASAPTAPRLKAYCLGGFKVYRDNEPVSDAAWKSRRAKTLFKILIAQEGWRLPREQAVDLLWPGDRSGGSRAAFNSLLHRARKVLEPETAVECSCIRQQEEMLVLDNERVWTDAGQFLACMEAARSLRAARKPEAALKEYEKAMQLYQGDFLPEDMYDDWSAPLRDRLRMHYLKALKEAADAAETTGSLDRSLAFHERLFLSDPCNEKACCWLMMRYHTDGRRNDAIRTYERCERSMLAELDLEPGAETKKVYRSIITV